MLISVDFAVKTKNNINLIKDLIDFFDNNFAILLVFYLLLYNFFLILKSFLK